MKTALVGYTGFVGGNLAGLHDFTNMYNSKNINLAFGTNPDLLIYSGVPAAKFLANSNAQADLEVCMEAFENIEKINPKKLVLISTVDVYESPNGANEDAPPSYENTQAYGRNRALLEKKVRQNYDNALIVRLPGLFGNGLKKNFIYDFLTLTPSMLKEDKFVELSNKSSLVERSYEKQVNGFYALTLRAKNEDKEELKNFFEKNNFNSLYFTHSRSYYQFYNLKYLYKDISKAINANIFTLNIATQPCCVEEIYAKLTGGLNFENELATQPVFYDMHTKYSEAFGGNGKYMYDKVQVLNDIFEFVNIEKLKQQ